MLNKGWGKIKKKIERFIKGYIKKSGLEGIVLGLSGGIDSCTASALCASAIGGDKVLGLLLPEQETYKVEDIQHAERVARQFGFKTQTIDISMTLENFYESIPIFNPQDKVSKGNIKARTRMVYIYYYANNLNRLVCGTSNKSETMIGYFTKWGDFAADISPIMDLYKTQVRKMARYIGIPEDIVTKPASPRLWPGQLAKEELGLGYKSLDLILYGLEHFMNAKEIAKQLDIKYTLVKKIEHRWLLMEHKRNTPLTTKIEYRTVGDDFRIPRDVK
ncbi:MAG: NAD+ synthase [Petrotogales bacterium]